MQNGLSKIQRKNSVYYHRITWHIFKTYYLYIKAINKPVSQSESKPQNESSLSQLDNACEKNDSQSEITKFLCSNLASLIHHSNLKKEFKLSLLMEKVGQHIYLIFRVSMKVTNYLCSRWFFTLEKNYLQLLQPLSISSFKQFLHDYSIFQGRQNLQRRVKLIFPHLKI